MYTLMLPIDIGLLSIYSDKYYARCKYNGNWIAFETIVSGSELVNEVMNGNLDILGDRNNE